MGLSAAGAGGTVRARARAARRGRDGGVGLGARRVWMDLVLEPQPARTHAKQQSGAAEDSLSTPERVTERHLILKAEQLELNFAESMLRSSEGKKEQVARDDLTQESARHVPRDVTRLSTKAKKVQPKKFGTGRHTEARMGSPPTRAAPAQDRARSSSRGRSRSARARSTLGSPARGLASPPRRAKSRSKLEKPASTPAREQKTLEQTGTVRKVGQVDLDELDQRWQRSLRLTRDETDSVRNELVAVQGHTLKEHQRRLAEMNAVRDQCARAQNGTREVRDALVLFTEKAEQQQVTCFDRLLKLETAVRDVSPDRWQRDLAAHTKMHGERLQEVNNQLALVAASVSQLDAKLQSYWSDHRASIGSLEDLTTLAVQQSATAVSQQQSTHATLLAEINLVRERNDQQHAALQTSLASSEDHEEATNGVAAETNAQALEAIAVGLRSEFTDGLESHRAKMAADAAQSHQEDDKRIHEIQTQLEQTCGGLRAENIDLASSVEELGTVLSSLTARCDRFEAQLAQQHHTIAPTAIEQLDLRMQTEHAHVLASIEALDKNASQRLAETVTEFNQKFDAIHAEKSSVPEISSATLSLDVLAEVEQRIAEHSRACAAKIQVLEDAFADASMPSFGEGEQTSLGLGDMLDEHHQHFTALCAKLERKIATLALSSQHQQQSEPQGYAELVSKLEDLAKQVGPFSHHDSVQMTSRLLALDEKMHGLESAVETQCSQLHETSAELLEACHETERGLSTMGQDCARAIEEQNQKLSVLDKKIARQQAEIHCINTLSLNGSTQISTSNSKITITDAASPSTSQVEEDEIAAAVAAIDEDAEMESNEEQSTVDSDKKDEPNVVVHDEVAAAVAAFDTDQESEDEEGASPIGERSANRTQIDGGAPSGVSAIATTKDNFDLDIDLKAMADELALDDCDGGEGDDDSIDLEEMALELADDTEGATLEELAAQLSLG
eukprot:COSAG02_NODE_1587_length_11808_cov_8.640875_2_plen_959_part_00